MPYDLTVLDPTEFEALVGDLLSKAWGTRLESFKPGQDGGIDLRHSRVPAGQPTTIVQCKRYATSAFGRLLTACKRALPKLAQIQPDRYILATSVPLSPNNKQKLLAALSPWCKSSGDIYGADEVNGFLRDSPEVERAHFKLWISGTAVLERVLHAGLFSFSDANVEEARHQISTLVVHPGVERALDLLREQHHVMIVGNPGIGKTTLARMLLCHYLAKDFDVAWLNGNIRDAWDRLPAGNESAQRLVIVYDDFLGRLRFDSPRFEKNEDASLFTLIRKISRSPNLRLILTTREYILQDAKRLHGTFADQAGSLLKYVLSLQEYSLQHRAKMVFNHLYFSDLPQTRIERFVEAKAYRTVVAHRHFNPRIVESISKHANSRTKTDDEFLLFVEAEFGNPATLWEHAYRSEIGSIARQVMWVLWISGGTAEIGEIRACLSRASDAASDPDFGQHFQAALRQVDGSFITTGRYPLWASRTNNFAFVVRFQNPSVEEFVEQTVLNDPSALAFLSKAVRNVRQAHKLLEHLKPSCALTLPPDYWQTVTASLANFGRSKTGRLQAIISGSDDAVTYWKVERITEAKELETQLMLDAKAAVGDEYARATRQRVLSDVGWESVITGTLSAGTTSDLLRLIGWIVNKSGWVEDERRMAQQCFQQALLRALHSTNIWIAGTETLVQLCEAATIGGFALEPELSEALQASAQKALEEEENEPDTLRFAARNLRKLGKMLCWPVDEFAHALEERAQALEDGMDHDESDEDADGFAGTREADDPFDIDELFAELLDRD